MPWEAEKAVPSGLPWLKGKANTKKEEGKGVDVVVVSEGRKGDDATRYNVLYKINSHL